MFAAADSPYRRATLSDSREKAPMWAQGIRTGMLAIGSAVAMTHAVLAADPRGNWLTEDREARIRIARCGGGALCGTITALRETRDPVTGLPKTDERNRDPRLRQRSLIGVRIIIGMRPNERSGEWAGTVYNPEDGGFYPAKITVRDQTLRLEGCMIPEALCGGQTWRRIR
jgi:uncharacterized protein (DUF2147 family)